MADCPAIDIPFPAADSLLKDRLLALVDDYEPLGILEQDHGMRVFFRTAPGRDAARTAIAEHEHIQAQPVDVPDEDWARRSQQDLRAIEIGDLIVAPPWDVPSARREAGGARLDLPVIIIEPSMGFGTGHHATTRLCLRLLQGLELRGARVLDVGAGSGVLALAAWKLGAADVVAVDNDADALENARGNIARNGAAPSIDIICDGIETLRIERADVVLANLTGAVLVRDAEKLAGLLRQGGYLIVSGFSPQEAAIVRTAFGGLPVIEETVEGDWAAICFCRR